MKANEQLKKWRLAEGLSAADAGKKIGVSKMQWYRMEKGERNIAATNVKLLEQITGIPAEQLRPDVFEPPKGAA